MCWQCQHINASELSSAGPAVVFNDEDNIFSARAHTTSHQRSSFFVVKGLSPRHSGRQVPQIIWVKQGHVGLTSNTIILKDLCRLMQSLLLEHHQPTKSTGPTSLQKNFDTTLVFCMSFLRRGHANLLCIVPILTDDLRRGS